MKHPIEKSKERLYYITKFKYTEEVPFKHFEEGRVYFGYEDVRGHILKTDESSPMGVIFPELVGSNSFSEYEIEQIDSTFLLDGLYELSEEDELKVVEFFRPKKDEKIEPKTKLFQKGSIDDLIDDDLEFEEEPEEDPKFMAELSEKIGEAIRQSMKNDPVSTYPNYDKFYKDMLLYMENNQYLARVDSEKGMYTPDSFVQLLRDFYWNYNENGRRFSSSDLYRLFARMIITLDNIYE